LHRLFPNASITILVRENLSELFAACPFAKEIIPLSKVSGGRKVSQLFRIASDLEKRKFDLAVSFPHSFSSAWMFWLAGIPERVGFSAEGRKIFLTRSLPYPPDGERPHRVRFYSQLVELVAGQKLTIPSLQVWPRPLNRGEAGELEQKVGGLQNLTVVAPGSVGPAKRWFADRFAEVVKKLVREKNVRVVLNLAGETSLSELYFLFQKSRLFLGNDSGAGHLAAAAGIPVVVLAGAGDPDEVAPWTETKTVLFKKIFCSPCYRPACRRVDHPLECMDLISTDEVWRAVESWLAKLEKPVASS
jgi:ADP-heptose:LPS heptosyltransferase